MPDSLPIELSVNPGDPGLAARLRREIEGEVCFDRFSRGRYATDASLYQIEPIGVVVPRTPADIDAAISIAGAEGVPVLPRGAGTSQCGQTVGKALVVDTSKHLNRIIYVDRATRRVKVQPGIVLDQLNHALAPDGLFFPVDVSPSNRATIGGMTGNNSCGARSIRYGNMVHNVRAVNAVLSDGTKIQFGDVPGNLAGVLGDPRYLDIVQRMRALGAREADEIAARFPKLLRRVGGYNIDSIDPNGHNMAHLLVGSEGTLGFFTEIELNLQAIPAHRVLGVCHFPHFYDAMSATQSIVALDPTAVELVDRTLMQLAWDMPIFKPTLKRCIRGEPSALLLVEFAGDQADPLIEKLHGLGEVMADLGFPNALVEATDPAFQRDIWEVRKAGLNIMMSMKGEGKPVSFIEDCAVRLEDLPEYTRRLDEIFARHGTSGTWYAHASVGTLHVRPILNLKEPGDVGKMREIAERCFEMIRQYKGSHSGEHGDGIVRSEFHRAMFGNRLVGAFEEVKDVFDPTGMFNPGKIVHPYRMDDRALFRYPPGYRAMGLDTQLDWSAWGGFGAAIEMCNNNGACRKASPGVMCPSYRVTRDEQHVTRGRANALRLALTGQLGPDALVSDDLYQTMDLCVGCKGCKRECPTGVDMARMKIEFLYHYRQRHGSGVHEKLIAYLPRYAPYAARVAGIVNLRDRLPFAARLTEKWFGFSARRSLPRWRKDYFGALPGDVARTPAPPGRDVVLIADTFNRWFEPENLRASLDVLSAAGYRVQVARHGPDGKALCCGRTFLALGLMDEARAEAQRLLDFLQPFVEAGIPVVGLEPSCLLTLRDEYPVLLPGTRTRGLAESAVLIEELLTREDNRLAETLQPLSSPRILLHGHCHQKALGVMGSIERCLEMIPGAAVETIESSCCGMAGAFGFETDHLELSLAMAEADLLPAVRAAPSDTVIVADGTSCRHQILDGAQREAFHVARVLARALPDRRPA